ncbi:transposase [Sorangium sp. So ce124]|uniref:transposase n=1 Tax=Sorangium sp. So ce124 TaxID=3133280 RepID=UPI003F5EACE2
MPPFSLERLALLPDGRIAYRLRRPRRNGATHLVLEPIAFMARLAALIPPPRYPLLRLVRRARAALVMARRSGAACASGERDEVIGETSEEQADEAGSDAAVPVSVERDGAPLAPHLGGECPGCAERSAHQPRRRRHEASRCALRLGEPAP